MVTVLESQPYVFFVLYLFVILGISHLWFECKTLVVFVQVPGHCIAYLFALLSKGREARS